MAPITALPASPPAVVIQVDPARCRASAAAPMGRELVLPPGAVAINGNYFYNGWPIGSLVDNGRPFRALPLKQSRAVLVIQGKKATIFRATPGDTRKRLQSGQWKTATVIQAGPMLVENGTVCLDRSQAIEQFRPDVFRTANHTAIGITKSGKLLLVFVRNRGLTEVARIMQRLGCVQALNLDGGGSASLRYGSHSWGSWPPRTALLFIPHP